MCIPDKFLISVEGYQKTRCIKYEEIEQQCKIVGGVSVAVLTFLPISILSKLSDLGISYLFKNTGSSKSLTKSLLDPVLTE